jgi:putative PIN family toxin of toxin-antitoxin system
LAAILGGLQIRLVSSIPLISELQGVLGRGKFQVRILDRGLTVRDLIDGYSALVEVVPPGALPPVVVRDPDDDEVLAAAAAGSADLIVSGDSDLLELRHFRGDSDSHRLGRIGAYRYRFRGLMLLNL